MSKIGKQPLAIPPGATVKMDGRTVLVSGPKGNLDLKLLPGINAEIKDDQLVVSASGVGKAVRSAHGLIRSLLANMLKGATQEFTKKLELVGTGYRVQLQGKILQLALGFSHEIRFEPPEGVTLAVEGQNKVVVSGIDKQLVGQTAANIRALRPPEPYKGKGIRYEGEVVRKKAGKQVKAVE